MFQWRIGRARTFTLCQETGRPQKLPLSGSVPRLWQDHRRIGCGRRPADGLRKDSLHRPSGHILTKAQQGGADQPDTRWESIDFSDSIPYSAPVAALSVSGGRPQTLAQRIIKPNNSHKSVNSKRQIDDQRAFPVRAFEGILRKGAQALVKASMLPFAKSDAHLVRYSMYQRLALCCSEIDWPKNVDALSISGSGFLTNLACAHAHTVDASYPEHNMVDLQFNNDSFDLVVSDQVLEHVSGNPFTAISESFRVLKPGGICIHATVMLYQIHGYPSDYWRFTPDALELLCEESGVIIESGGWGNRYIWLLNYLGLIEGFSVPESRFHPYNAIARFNEWRYPVVTWVVAQKKLNDESDDKLG